MVLSGMNGVVHVLNACLTFTIGTFPVDNNALNGCLVFIKNMSDKFIKIFL